MNVGIDPGLRECGVAGVAEGLLRFAFLVRNPVRPPTRGPEAWAGMAGAVAAELQRRGVVVESLALEGPKVYVHGKGDPADLIQLAGVLGELHARINPKRVIYYARPADWKGTMDGDQFIRTRIRPRVGAQGRTELVELPRAKGDHEHVWDACGIALHSVGGLELMRVYPRE